MESLRFQPFTTVVSPTFWIALGRRKLNELRLDDGEINIWGYYGPGSSQFYITEDCLSPAAEASTTAQSTMVRVRVEGRLKLSNTMEEFKLHLENRKSILDDVHQDIMGALSSAKSAKSAKSSSPSYNNFKVACRFRMFAFADLKKHRYYYHCLYPTLISDFAYSKVGISDFDIPAAVPDDGWTLMNDGQQSYAVIDPSDKVEGVVGWPVRNLLLWSTQLTADVSILCLKGGNASKQPILLKVRNKMADSSKMLEATGWERNEQGQIAPRNVDLSPLLDPKQYVAGISAIVSFLFGNSLAKEAADLNLKLIKWRLMPLLELEKFSNCRVLLFGAGTLGCNIIRVLLGWGFKRISVIDDGRVSHSNPPRQSLYKFEDCHTVSTTGTDASGSAGTAAKAETAARRAMEIDPSAMVTGHDLHVPMPGHRIPSISEAIESIERIWSLIKEHDVIFLLTDSRESRWLPTVLGALEGKLVITVAIGFDSYVVLRHGDPVNRLACYFCNDIHGPGDTLSNRTLDQQCTVTRPGVSYVASGMAVELLASLLQHPLGASAPAIVSLSPTDQLPAEASILGVVPHQLRGYMGHFNNLQLTGEAFSNCTACSAALLDAIRSADDGGVKFILRALQDPSYLAEVSGAKALQTKSQHDGESNSIDDDDVIEFDILD